MTEKPNRTAEMADILHQASMLYMASNPDRLWDRDKIHLRGSPYVKIYHRSSGKNSHRALPRMGPHQAGDLPDVKTHGTERSDLLDNRTR